MTVAERPMKVVSLDAARATRKAAAVRQVEGYWEGLRAGRLVPARAELDPRGLEGALNESFLLERIAPGHARIRIAGQRLCDLMGMDMRGMPFSTLFLPAARDDVADALQAVFDEPAKVEFDVESAPGLARPALTGTVLLLPMQNDFGEITRALGCFVSDGALGRTPRRFTIEAQRRRTLVGYAGGPSTVFDGFDADADRGAVLPFPGADRS